MDGIDATMVENKRTLSVVKNWRMVRGRAQCEMLKINWEVGEFSPSFYV